MTLLFVVDDDGKTTAIIVEDRADELGPRRAPTQPPRRRRSRDRPPGRRRVLSRDASASQLDPDLIYNYHAVYRIQRLCIHGPSHLNASSFLRTPFCQCHWSDLYQKLVTQIFCHYTEQDENYESSTLFPTIYFKENSLFVIAEKGTRK